MISALDIKKRGFTLVELLVVMGIMALLVLVAMPMFSGLTRSSGMSGATMQLRTTLSLARQWAITHRAVTYVVFPTDPNIESDKGTGVTSRIQRSYNVYTAQDGFIRDWIYLPDGIFFDKRPTTSGDNVLNWTPSSPYSPVTIAYPLSDSTNPVPCLSFRPDGSTTGVGDIFRQPQIYLTEGTRDFSTGTIQYKTPAMVNILQASSTAGQIKLTKQ